MNARDYARLEHTSGESINEPGLAHEGEHERDMCQDEEEQGCREYWESTQG